MTRAIVLLVLLFGCEGRPPACASICEDAAVNGPRPGEVLSYLPECECNVRTSAEFMYYYSDSVRACSVPEDAAAADWVLHHCRCEDGVTVCPPSDSTP